MGKLPKGEDFLPNIPLSRLNQIYNEETKAKPKVRILMAIHRKEGRSLDEIAAYTNNKRRTVHEILWRLIKRGIDGKDSIKQHGRPPKLTIQERKELIERLDQRPPYNKSGLWTTKEVREMIRKKFGVKYSKSHVWELLTVAGFSIQKPRQRNYKAPPKSEIKRFKKRLACWRVISE